MRSEPRHGLIRRTLFRAIVLVLALSVAAWLFLAGLASLPRLLDPANLFLRAAYVVAWVLFCVIAARAYQRAAEDRHRRHQAESIAAQSDRISELIGALAQARTPAAAMEAALQEPLHALHADAGLIILVGRGTASDMVRTVGYKNEEREARTAAKPGAKTPASDAIGRGAMVLIESRSAWAVEYPHLPRDAFEAIAAVPLLIGSRVFAVVQLEFRGPRRFGKADREYLDVLGSRAAHALDRTWEHDAALNARAEADDLRKRAEQELAERLNVERALRASEAKYRALVARTTRLHGMAAALSEAATLQAVARAVVQHGRNVLGAASGEVEMLVDNGSAFETIFSDGRGASAQGVREPAEPGLCATEVVRTRRPVFVTSFDQWQESYARSAALAADGGYVSSATLPLLVEGTVVGVLAFHFTAPVNFDADYGDLLESVARHCAQAVERARLYEAADEARAEAERANRHKDELVSIVSHELRTPLNAILGWTSMLEQGVLDSHGSARALHSIADNATRQVRLVEDLLDFSRLQSGRMALEVEEVDLGAVLRSVVESIVPVAANAGLQLDVSPLPRVWVHGDMRRLEQVFLNLLGNAVKFTPEGGRVALSVRAEDDAVEVRISDTGSGIDAAFIPHMFEAFRQADSTAARRYGGVGLGLSIAKELVEAHKGRIEAESAGTGRGATFIVTLPAFQAAEASDEHALTGKSPGQRHL
ncbi:MAG TPA: GAF domain-containing sensor histidine kinase [Vicinamibacterales bacterium]|nr:GAF domain-containing sensor histidine kinase [Vicinamibacterales bacterium]